MTYYLEITGATESRILVVDSGTAGTLTMLADHLIINSYGSSCYYQEMAKIPAPESPKKEEPFYAFQRKKFERREAFQRGRI